MKKILLFALTLGFTLSSMAQETDYSEHLHFGLKLGTNYSNVYDTKGEEFTADAKYGLAAGAFVVIPIGSFFAIQPEFLFSQKGFKGTGKLLGSTYDLTRTTNYLDIPLLLSFSPVSMISIVAGPQYSYLMKQHDEFTVGTTTIDQEKEFQNDNFRKNTLCFLAGVDVNINHVVIGGRLGWDILNNQGDGTSDTPRYKNAWYQLTLGYRFYN